MTRYERALSLAAQAILEAAIEEAEGNRSEAARLLELNRTHFYRLCWRHGVELKDSATTDTYRRVGRVAFEATA